MNQVLTIREINEFIEEDKASDLIFQQFSGIEEDEVSFFNCLYDLAHCSNVQLFEDDLDRTIENTLFHKIEQFYQILKENPKLSAMRIVAFMQGFDLILSREFLQLYVPWIEALIIKQPEFKVSEQFRRIFTDCIKWSFTYLNAEDVSKVQSKKLLLWYKQKPVSASQDWFIMLSQALGYQVLLIDISKQYPSKVLPLVELNKEKERQAFPTKRVEVISTVAREASLEFNALMNQADESGQGNALFFKPFQFKEAQLQVVSLRTTYDELKILGTSEAYLRPGFKVQGNELTLPVLLAKVNGVLENEADYWVQLEALGAVEFRHQEELKLTSQEKAQAYALYHEFIQSSNFVAEVLIEREEWPYDQLSTGAQLMLAKAIIEAIQIPKVELKPKEQLEVFQASAYAILLNLPPDLIQIFHQFDYPKRVPKLLWFDRPEEIMSREDALQFLLFHAIGFDCLIYSPNGLNSIENHMVELTMDVFWLDQLKDYTLENKKVKKGFFKRWLGE